MTKTVARDEILDYVTYEERRGAIRDAGMRTKAPRRVHVGPHLTFLFENHETIRYQVLEMVPRADGEDLVLLMVQLINLLISFGAY